MTTLATSAASPYHLQASSRQPLAVRCRVLSLPATTTYAQNRRTCHPLLSTISQGTLIALTLGTPARALAQAELQPAAITASSHWTIPLVIALAVAMLVAAFWNRRLAHERRERRRLEQRLLDLTNNLPACVLEYRVNPDGTMKGLFANPSARRMFRLPVGEHKLSLDDPSLLKHVHPDDRERLRAVTRRSVDTLDPIDVSFQFKQANGQYRWLRATMAVRVLNDGAVVWTGSIHDTTELRQLESEIQNIVASKDLFFAAASQNLRKPIHTIGLALDQLISERNTLGRAHRYADDPSGKDATDHPLQQAHEQSMALRELIDDLLELAKVQRGDLPLRPGDFSLQALLKGLEHELQIPFARKSIKLLIKLNPDTPDRLYGDHQRIRQVLVNLIDSALLHTQHGSVTVAIAPLRIDDPQHSTPDFQTLRLQFSVTDTSPGMTPDQLDQIFEPFVSHQAVANNALTRSTAMDQAGDLSATGLGLAIGQRIVIRMGGTIDIASVPGQGTSANFELPLEIRSPAALLATPSPGKQPDNDTTAAQVGKRVKTPFRKHRQVLVVDDDRLSRSLLATLLGKDGFQVIEAPDGANALRKLKHSRIDAIITNVRLPDMDGESLAAEIRRKHTKDPLLTPLPRLIALNASFGGMNARESSDGNFDVQLQQPVAIAELVAALESPAVPQASNKA